MNGDMSFTATNCSDQLARESIRAAHRRHDAGLVLRDARRAALANPHDLRNPAIVSATAARVVTAQERLDLLNDQTTHSNDQRRASA